MTHIVKKIHLETSSPVWDAVSFLSAAQRDVLDLFNQYDQSSSKKAVARKICNALMIIMQIEEEIFHPAVKKVVKDNGSISAAIMEHSILKYLISEIEGLDEDSSVFGIKMSVLAEHVKEHFMAEQLKLFPKVIASKKIDLWMVGTQLANRKRELETHKKINATVKSYAR